MRVLRWLHISDLHMRESETAQREAVLSAMLEDIRNRGKARGQPDFVVVTGDLAFSGRRSEYELVAKFLGELANSVGLTPEQIFCVPGNHDVQRERSKMSFRGARDALESEVDVYRFLADDAERETLLLRLERFREFESAFFLEQEREYTEDGLGYVSTVEVEDLRVAIVGLNSSWLSEGGVNDEGKLIIGESQVKNAIDIAKRRLPHVMLALQHHPFDLLRRFDRRPVQHRIEQACQFLHCGHLHDPEVKDVRMASGRCITVTAGASFESRVSRNTYTAIELDPLAGNTEVEFIQYNPQVSAYEYVSLKTLDFAIDGLCDCTVAELATAIDSFCDSASRFSGYLARLLLGFSSDVPMPVGDEFVFGNWDSIDGIGDDALKSMIAEFRGLSRIVRLLHGRKPLLEILEAHCDSILPFVRRLESVVEMQPAIEDYMTMQNNVGTQPHAPRSSEPLRHTMELLVELVTMDDWDAARNLAERTIKISHGASKVKVARFLALCLARSTEHCDKARAVDLYREAMNSEQAEPGDYGALATLMVELGRHEEAKANLYEGMKQFPDQCQLFLECAMRVVEVTGDRAFRNRLIEQAQGEQCE